MSKKVIVIGGGAAGMMAAGTAASLGAHVTLLERNSNLGKKIYLTGKGRCNITNDTDREGILKNMPGNGKFLYPALDALSPGEVREFFARFGVPTKVERGDRVFPVSDRAGDVVKALTGFLKKTGVDIKLGCRVKRIETGPRVESENADETATAAVTGVVFTEEGRTETSFLEADAVIIATGGASYPGTGSTGDGYKLAGALGHKIIEPRPALVPLVTVEDWVPELMGLSLKNARVTAYAGGKKLGEDFGEMLFTHFGLSGPVILSLSRAAGKYLREKGGKVTIVIDLKPALDKDKLDQRLQRDFSLYARKQYKNALDDLLPKKLIPVIIKLSGIDIAKAVHQISREERYRLVELLKGLRCTVKGTRPIEEAIVTAGGVSVKEVDPRSMESKLVKGLYLAGEVLDIDGYTGGFNLQAAFSTGFLAGQNASGQE